MSEQNITLKISDDDSDVAYLQLPDHLGEGTSNVVAKSVRLLEIIQNYKGPDIYLDFGHDEKLIGIEILV
jgi:uncharacterized protein YuzE